MHLDTNQGKNRYCTGTGPTFRMLHFVLFVIWLILRDKVVFFRLPLCLFPLPFQSLGKAPSDQILTVQLLKSWWLKGRLCPQMSFSKQLDNDHFLLMQTGARHPLSKCEVNPDPTLDCDRGRQGELLLALHEDCHRVGGRGVVGWRWACPLWETINLVLVMIRMWKLLCVRIYIVIFASYLGIGIRWTDPPQHRLQHVCPGIFSILVEIEICKRHFCYCVNSHFRFVTLYVLLTLSNLPHTVWRTSVLLPRDWTRQA